MTHLALSLVLSLLSVAALAAVELREGDVIFHKSNSGQSNAIRALTGSQWTHVGLIVREGSQTWVAEASNKVKLTSLSSFINRGRDGEYLVKRPDPRLVVVGAAESAKLRTAFAGYYQDEYDIWFQWSDDAIYCSELVWKLYKNALGVELSAPKTFRDFNLDRPEARDLIRNRYTNQGRAFNRDETVVAPSDLDESSRLQTVIHVKPVR